jgi:transposase
MFGDVVEQLIERYDRLAKDKDVTLVFDGGNNSKKNIEKLDQSGYYFIVDDHRSLGFS